MLKMHTGGKYASYYKKHTECLYTNSLAIDLLLSSLNYEWVDTKDCLHVAVTVCGIFDIDKDRIVYCRSNLMC